MTIPVTTKRILLALGVLLLATTAFAADLPPGKWWKRPEIQQMLQLTDDQQTRLDGVFRAAADDLIDLKATVEKASINLRGELDQPQLNRQSIRAAGSRLSEARARLFERELAMLVDMRGVLNDAQWSRMRTELDRVPMQPKAMQRQNRRQ